MTDQIERGRVEDALTAILTSDKFAVAPQMSAFLNYVVHETLAGNANRIKAYTVAVDALGKPDSFDPQNDPSVRVLAKRLRSALDNYYLLFPETAVIVEMKAGSYVPKFVLRAEQQENTSLSAEAAPAQLVDASRAPSVGFVSSHGSAVASANDALDGQTGAEAQSTHKAATAHSEQQPDAENAAAERGTSSFLDRASRPAIAMAVATALFMGLAINSLAPTTSSISQASAEALPSGVVLAATVARDSTQSGTQPSLAAARAQESATNRPAAPVIYVNFPNNDDPLDGQIADTISTVLARFDELDIRRTTALSESRDYWPEEYRLIMSSLALGADVRVEAQLLHADSGRIVHSRTFTIEQENLSRSDLSEIESFAAQLAQIEGPVFKDYQLVGDLSERMSCFMSLQKIAAITDVPRGASATGATDTENESSPESRLSELDFCLAEMSGDNRHQARALIYQAHARLLSTALAEKQDVPGQVKAALNASREAVNLLPYDSSAHTVLMMSLKAKGDLTQAREFGERALELNPFDQRALAQMSALLEQMGEQQRADQLRKEAESLHSQQSLSVL